MANLFHIVLGGTTIVILRKKRVLRLQVVVLVALELREFLLFKLLILLYFVIDLRIVDVERILLIDQ